MGCSVRDLAVMTDGHMKRRLEHAARLIEELRNPARQEALMIMGARAAAPSVAHILVVEALIILLSPSKVFNACRGSGRLKNISISSMKEATWAQVRFILMTPEKLLTAMAGVDEYCISPANISSLKVTWLFLTFTMDTSIMIGTHDKYISRCFNGPTDRPNARSCGNKNMQAYLDHNQWPRNKNSTSGEDDALYSLAAWVRSLVEFAVLINEAGGRPPHLCQNSATPKRLFSSIITVHDEDAPITESKIKRE